MCFSRQGSESNWTRVRVKRGWTIEGPEFRVTQTTFKIWVSSSAWWAGIYDLNPWGRVCVTWFAFHFLKLVCDTLKIICYSGAWQIKGSHRFFWHSSHWRVGSIFIPLESGQALWLFWPIEYGESDALPVFPAYVFTNWQLLTSSVLEHLPMYLPTRLWGGPSGSCCGPCERDKPRETQTRASVVPMPWVTRVPG